MRRWSGDELVLALTLLGLVAIIAPMAFRYHTQRELQKNLSQCESNEKNIATACEMYSTDYGGRYPTALAALTPNYLHMLPTCPAAASDTYAASYQSASNPDAYTFCCQGHWHAPLVGPNLPRSPWSTMVSGH